MSGAYMTELLLSVDFDSCIVLSMCLLKWKKYQHNCLHLIVKIIMTSLAV